MYQLTRENNKSTNETKVWSYDDLGNIESVTIYPFSETTLSTATKTITYDYGEKTETTPDGEVTSWNNILLGVDLNGNSIYEDAETITYDAIGNPTEYLGNDLLWTGRELYRYQNDNFRNTYYYDSEGLRSRKNIYVKNADGGYDYNGKVMYQYLGGLLTYQCTYNAADEVDTEMYFFYDSYSRLTAIRYISSIGDYYYYVTTNKQGDVLGLYSANGNLKVSYEYDAWGNCNVKDASGNAITSSIHIGNVNPIRYRSYYYDTDTGMYYLQSRYYDAAIGRFINADGYVGTSTTKALSYNMFAYCLNNPIAFSDPSGCSVWGLIILGGLALIGILVLGGCSAQSVPVTTNDSTSSNTPQNNDGHSSTEDLTEEQMNQNAELVYNMLIDKGWSHNAICAVLGNAQKESITINPGRWQNGDGPGYGIVQWDPATKYLNSSFCGKYGATSLIGQVEYLDYSMRPGNGEWFCNNSYPGYYLDYNSFITSNASVSYLTEVFLWSYERPSVPHLEDRIAYAQYWDSYFS